MGIYKTRIYLEITFINNIMVSLLLFLSIIMGLMLAYLIKSYHLSIKSYLRFSSAYLLGTVFTHLFPQVYRGGQKGVGFFVLGGILVQLLLETITKGIEHGHILTGERNSFSYSVFIGLFTHSFLESMTIHQGSHSLLYAIMIHKIPVSAILYFFLKDSFESKKKVLFWVGIFSLFSPLGVWVGEFPIFSRYETYINAFIAGIFIHIATIIWFENSDGHRIDLSRLLIFLLGIALSYLFS